MAENIKWYRVFGSVTVSAWSYVQAESAEEAVANTDGRESRICEQSWMVPDCEPTETAIVEEADGGFCPTRAELADRHDLKVIRECTDEEEET